MNYTNLKELIENHDYSIEVFADHANVTVDVLKAALDGKEELSGSELYGIVSLTGFPYNALVCSKLIMMDNKRYRHRMLISRENEKVRSIVKAAGAGSRKAIQYVERHYWNYEDGTSTIWTSFMDGKPISYALYFCSAWSKDDCLKDIENEKRGVRSARELIEATSTSEETASKKNENLVEFLKSVDELQRFVTAHGEPCMIWDVFMKLSNLMDAYMLESKQKGIREGGAE